MATPPPTFSPKSAALRTLSERGFVEQTSDSAAIDEALDSAPVTFYIGYDPTAASLHVGNLVCIMAMRIMQQHGHHPIVLLGGGTGRVGDPSGRSESRSMLDAATVDANFEGIGKQFAPFLHFDAARGNPARVVDNHSWLSELGYIAFLRDIGSHFTVNRMIATKTYRERLDNEQPLSFSEFNYQLLQAYDFLHLFRTEGCTMQMGGSDQWGNMIAGVELIRRVGARDRGPAQCLTFPLLTTTDGRKMGKSQRGAVWLDPALLSPFEYYQFWISCDDRDVRRSLLTFTDVPVDEVDALCKAEGAALRDVKSRLALEATRTAHGEQAATDAAAAASQAFGGGGDWSAVPSVSIGTDEIRLLDLVVDERVGAFSSKRQARQRIEGGAVRIDGDVEKDATRSLLAADFPGATLRLQAGKKCRVRVVLG